VRYCRAVHCIVTAGPTYEPLDQVRRLTNFSTGRLGAELANSLTQRGHSVTLLLGEHSTYRGELRAQKVQTFTTTADLEEHLRALASRDVDAVFHTSAVSDFKFGRIWVRSEKGDLAEVKSGKLSTREGILLAELVPTSKILNRLRDWFPSARLVGWKFEVEGDRARVIELAQHQILECRTDGCVANGPAYGAGFGLVLAQEAVAPLHVPDSPKLYEALLRVIEHRSNLIKPPGIATGPDRA
jgi:phosphopantothenoylcysteine synthetase/decarboxylase